MATDHPISPPKTRPSSQVSKKRPTRLFWIKTLAEFSKSRLSVQQFCRLKKLSPSNFYSWRKRLREEESDASLVPASFIPLEVMPTAPSPDPSKELAHNQEVPLSPDIERGGNDSGLTLHVNKDLKISIDKDFHEPTLQRLVKVFTSGVPSEC